MRDWKTEVRRRLAGRSLRPTREAEIVEELSQHLQDRYNELRAGGASELDATREALAELEDDHRRPNLRAGVNPVGDGLQAIPNERLDAGDGLEAVAFKSGGRPMLAAVWQDLRYAARTLRKNPGFTTVVVLTLALGIGSTTAIFSVVNAVMLRPLPFAESDRLVRIWESDLPRGRPTFSVSQPNFLDFRDRNRSFEYLAASSGAGFNLSSNDGVEAIPGSAVTASFLPVLGASPALGRNFLPEEDRPGANRRVVIITHGFWQRRLGGDASVLARTLALNDSTYQIVGVLPQAFAWGAGDLFVPLAPDPAQNRGDHRLLVIGRLKRGVTLEQANADMHAIARQLSDQFPESNGGWSVLLRSFYDWMVPEQARQSVLIFLAAVGFVLLVACANVANLLLARASARQKEISIRAALGAARGRVISQLLVESLVLAASGGALGCGVAIAMTKVLKALGPAAPLPRMSGIGIDATVLGFAMLVSIATALVFGLVPAIQASRPNVTDALKEGGRSGGGGLGRQRLRNTLVVAEVALSVALLVGAGLLIRSMWALQNVDPGFRTHNLLTMQVNVAGSRYPTEAKRQSVFQQILTNIAALPGVQAAAASSIVPMSGGNTSIEIIVEGRPADNDGILPSADWRVVSPGYFHTLGVPLRGRDFSERDAADTSDNNLVAIVSEDMARRYWPGIDPIGRDFHWHSATGPRFKVVGVAGDVRALSLDIDPRPMVYLPFVGQMNSMTLTIRTSPEPTGMVSAVRNAVQAADARVPVARIQTADEIVAASLGPRRFNMLLLGCFAGIALVLACVGLFGVMSYLVSQRTHDIGVRLALGALPGDVFRLIVGRGMLLALGGSMLGLAGAFWLSKSLEGLLFRVKPGDPVTFGGVMLLLMAVAFAACYVPARRATRVDPVTALRYE